MEPKVDDLIAGIKKGKLDSKLEAYRLLLVRHFQDPKAIAAMQKKLATEPNGAIFKKVEALDKLAGSRLDWGAICRERLLKCKSADGRYDAISKDVDYGTGERDVFENVVLNDPDDGPRFRALDVMFQKNDDTSDSYYFDLLTKYLATAPDNIRRRPTGIYYLVGLLSPTLATRNFLEAELAANPLANPSALGRTLKKKEYIAAFSDTVRQLCETQFGTGPGAWKNIKPAKEDRSHSIYLLLTRFISSEKRDPP